MEPKVWNLAELLASGPPAAQVSGEPAEEREETGKAVRFNGTSDALLVAENPIAGWARFTVEILFRPDPEGLAEQRFFHIQEGASESRLLLETRILPGNRWSLDTYLHSARGSQTLLDLRQTHPLGEWFHAALVYDGTEMRHYVNGLQELAAPLAFEALGPGATSIGMRINRVCWFKGAIRQVRFSPEALGPARFTGIPPRAAPPP